MTTQEKSISDHTPKAFPLSKEESKAVVTMFLSEEYVKARAKSQLESLERSPIWGNLSL